jgi:hypothetical protein
MSNPYYLVGLAKSHGLIKKNDVCHECGRAENVIQHHPDGNLYDALDTVPMCRSCHGEWHAQYA